MSTIVDNTALAEFCNRLAGAEYITVDTEFMREKTYWPKLCLIQIANTEVSGVVDALAEGIDLQPVFDLMDDTSLLKVFHAARQDLEIFYHLNGRLPEPIFDTQVAAMVCGFGDAAGYETLVNKLARTEVDKSSRFTDWSHRPLTDRQIEYALADVTHLRTVYDKLSQRLEKNGRRGWLEEEISALTDINVYEMDPRFAWQRIKSRNPRPRFLAVLREVAAWRESEAQSRDLPRNRVLRDEAMIEIAHHVPTTAGDLARTRGLGRGLAEGRGGAAILKAVTVGKAVADDDCPTVERKQPLPRGIGPVTDLLKVLLKMRCEDLDVAAKLVATSPDIEKIAAFGEDAEVAALKGWRREVFGSDALALCEGRIALKVDGKALKLVEAAAPVAASD